MKVVGLGVSHALVTGQAKVSCHTVTELHLHGEGEMCGEKRSRVNGCWTHDKCVDGKLKGLLPWDVGSGYFLSVSVCENWLFMLFVLNVCTLFLSDFYSMCPVCGDLQELETCFIVCVDAVDWRGRGALSEAKEGSVGSPFFFMN